MRRSEYDGHAEGRQHLPHQLAFVVPGVVTHQDYFVPPITSFPLHYFDKLRHKYHGGVLVGIGFGEPGVDVTITGHCGKEGQAARQGLR